MFGLMLRAVAIAFLGILLAACGTRPRPTEIERVYEIRAVMVTANGGVSRTLMRGIKTRLDKAIHNTVRPVPMPRAVMNIHIVGAARGEGYDGTRMQTEVSVTLTDVPSGQPVLVRSFLVYSFSLSEQDADDAAAEAVAARLRVEYALAQPVIREQNYRRPTYLQPEISTRMRGDERPAKVQLERPIVIPLRTAPVLGADQDPILNSKTRVEPENKDATVPETRMKSADPASSENALEAGAKAKVVIKPATAEPQGGEPCVETMDRKCD